MLVLGAEKGAEVVCSQGGVAGRRIAERGEDMGIGGGGKVKVPVGGCNDLGSGWVEGF